MPPLPANAQKATFSDDRRQYDEEDRRQALSALEQTAERLGVVLNRWRQLVAANDRGWLPALEAMNATAAEIKDVRAFDMAAQGLTPADHEAAVRDVAQAEWRGSLARVVCPDGANSWHADLLYRRADETLLISPDRWSYSGPRVAAFQALALQEPGKWAGGTSPHCFFGVPRPSPRSMAQMEALFWRPSSAGAAER